MHTCGYPTTCSRRTAGPGSVTGGSGAVAVTSSISSTATTSRQRSHSSRTNPRMTAGRLHRRLRRPLRSIGRRADAAARLADERPDVDASRRQALEAADRRSRHARDVAHAAPTGGVRPYDDFDGGHTTPRRELRRDGARQRRPARFASVVVEELAHLIIGGNYPRATFCRPSRRSARSSASAGRSSARG